MGFALGAQHIDIFLCVDAYYGGRAEVCTCLSDAADDITMRRASDWRRLSYAETWVGPTQQDVAQCSTSSNG